MKGANNNNNNKQNARQNVYGMLPENIWNRCSGARIWKLLYVKNEKKATLVMGHRVMELVSRLQNFTALNGITYKDSSHDLHQDPTELVRQLKIGICEFESNACH